jgi:DNA-binding MarR family transcriptional regulator
MSKALRLQAAFADYAAIRKVLVSSTEDWRQLDLSMAQLKCLVELYRSGEKSVGAIAEALRIGVPAASLLIDRVVNARLVERRGDPDDRRRVLLRLTSLGEETAFRLSQGRAALLQEWMNALSEADFAALAQGLRALAEVASVEKVPR